MSTVERSISDVLQDIIANIQDIVRSEVRLAKTELREEAGKARGAALLTAIGAVLGIFTVLFLLWTLVYAFAIVMPLWLAALIVTGILALAAGATLMAGLKRFQQVAPKPDRAIASVKENVKWVKQQVK